MIRKLYRNVNLHCVMQEKEVNGRDCRRGLLSRHAEGEFLFEEVIAERRRVARPKLFNGELVSLVRLDDGTYRIYLKAKKTDVELRDSQFPFRVYTELVEVCRFIHEEPAADFAAAEMQKACSESSAASDPLTAAAAAETLSAAVFPVGFSARTTESSADSSSEGNQTERNGSDSQTAETINETVLSAGFSALPTEGSAASVPTSLSKQKGLIPVQCADEEKPTASSTSTKLPMVFESLLDSDERKKEAETSMTSSASSAASDPLKASVAAESPKEPTQINPNESSKK